MTSSRASETLGIDIPIVQAGMAASFTGSDLVVAVSEAGGLGVLGCLNRSVDDTIAQLERIRAATTRPFGVNFVVEHLDPEVFDACLARRPPVFTFFRGDPARVVGPAKATGAIVVYQVTTADEADAALGAGADVLIAQGREAGGHVGPVPLAEIVPAVVGISSGRPVLAAGGIVDGWTLAEALRMGADGAWIGTRFLATPESPARPAHKRAILDAGEGSTIRTPLFDRIWGRPWPGVEVRAIRNALTDRWEGRLADIDAQRIEVDRAMTAARDRDDAAEMDLLAGEGVGRISTIIPAADLVRTIWEDTLRRLRDEAVATG